MGVLVYLWILTGALQYGFHISALNASQLAIICTDSEPPSFPPTCFNISNAQFGIIVAAFTVGGLSSSIFAGGWCEKRGRRAIAMWSAVLVLVGTLLLGGATSFPLLVVSRYIIGLGSGMSTVNVPLYLAEVSPAERRGSVGVLNQVSICTGILLALLASLFLVEPGSSSNSWRMVPLVSSAIAVVQIVTTGFMIESPSSNRSQNLGPLADESADPLLLPSVTQESFEAPSKQLSIREVLASDDAEVKRGFRVVAVSQTFQQLSGINAALYYSTAILSAILPFSSSKISLLVAAANLLALAIPVFTVEKLGRRTLLLSSLFLMSTSSFTLGYGLNYSVAAISAISMISFVSAFAIGLGPMPFVILAELPPPHARSAIASIGLATNWGLNICVGLFFLPLSSLLSGDGKQTGNVFYLFGIISLLGLITLRRML